MMPGVIRRYAGANYPCESCMALGTAGAPDLFDQIVLTWTHGEGYAHRISTVAFCQRHRSDAETLLRHLTQVYPGHSVFDGLRTAYPTVEQIEAIAEALFALPDRRDR